MRWGRKIGRAMLGATLMWKCNKKAGKGSERKRAGNGDMGFIKKQTRKERR